MQPFLLLVPALCAGFVYSAPATFVDFSDDTLSVSVAGVSGGTTTFVVEGDANFPGATATLAGTATATFVEDGSGLHVTASVDGAILEETCSWDSASTAANCVVVAKATQTTATVSGVQKMFFHTVDAAVTNAPSATDSGSGASASGDAKPNGAASITPYYQWTVVLLGGMAGAFFVW
ncbi:hypothetical protein BD779DRAFT_1480634 [Infundibulicybe gibba]|nr:hypothetical protein BD779DRAFT_1480634 [Infundibulicybe gibba]